MTMRTMKRCTGSDGRESRKGRARTPWLLALAAASMLAVAAVGCGSDDAMGGFDEAPGTDPVVDSPIQRAVAAMFDHDLARARALFAEAREGRGERGRAAAGHAVTSLLLLPFSAEVDSLLVDHLGASSGLGDGSLLYGEQGLLYYLSLGTPWDDADGLVGIQTQLRDEIPWTDAQMESPAAFVAGLDSPVSELTDDLASLGDALGRIEDDLQAALDDPDFRFLFVPGQAFHDDDLSLFLGRAELSIVHALVSASRGAIYFVASYEYDFTLEQAFGERWQQVIDDPAAHPDTFVEGWTYDDYVNHFLDGQLFREVRSTIYLSQAGRSFQSAVHHLGAALEYAFDLDDNQRVGGREDTLDWSAADPTAAEEIVEVLDAIERSFDGPTVIPRSFPSTTMDLSVFFDGGRVLPEGTPWLERRAIDPEYEEYQEWYFTDAAYRSFFIDGVFDPGFDPDNPPEIRFTGDTETFGDDIAAGFTRDVEDAYFSTR